MQATHRPPVYRCIDCGCYLEGTPPTLYLCPSCQERADEAQRDHQIREAAHDMLEALEATQKEVWDSWEPKVKAAIAKARGVVE